jgi:hypothetical protein
MPYGTYIYGSGHEGNPEEENNGYVVFKKTTISEVGWWWGWVGDTLPSQSLSTAGFWTSKTT